MKWFITILIFIGSLAVTSYSQTAPPCPAGFVCITPEAAKAALEAGDKAKALQVELDTLKMQTVPQLKDALNDMRVQYAEAKGELTVLRQDRVEWLAEKELLLKLVRPKKVGLINLF